MYNYFFVTFEACNTSTGQTIRFQLLIISISADVQYHSNLQNLAKAFYSSNAWLVLLRD